MASKDKNKGAARNSNWLFSIVGIRILRRCSQDLRKIVKPGYYWFNQWCEVKGGEVKLKEDRGIAPKFFGSNISIQAIVGKNGSGKSSILELIYRTINNFGALLVQDQPRPAAEKLYVVKGLFIDLYFVVGNELGILYCRGENVGFKYKKYKIVLGEKQKIKEFAGFQHYESVSNDEIVNILSSFFYTIVTNYSFQAFIGSDYSKEETLKTDDSDSDSVWIDRLFHKNDGYVVPIVLNPYRDEGKIDLRKEYDLTNYRLSAILVEASVHNREFIDGYELESIKYQFNASKILKRFREIDNCTNDGCEKYFVDKVSKHGDSRELTFGAIILNAYGYPLEKRENVLYQTACMYLVIKTLDIASKYPSFSDYKAVGDVGLYGKFATKDEKVLLDKLVKEIKKKKSHITVKVRQVLHFFECLERFPKQDKSIRFTYEEYLKYQGKIDPIKGLDEIMEYLPPSFFTFEIYLNRIEKRNDRTDTPILFNRMSAGERQFIYTITTLIYHIKNLLSIQQSNRVRYRLINLVLDEIELCFHPEYQRLFVDKLVQTIQRLHLNISCGYNIILSTHSPFILSDIPKSNILYLDEGRPNDKAVSINPFGANINDILMQSFFLENGFIGGYAQKRIKSLLDFLLSDRIKDDYWNEKSVAQFIDVIGDGLIREQLEILFKEKYGNKNYSIYMDDKDREIMRLKKELNDLKAKR